MSSINTSTKYIVFCFLLCHRIQQINCFFLSSNRFSWDGANFFCINHCESTLAIIHSIDDFHIIKLQSIVDPLLYTDNNENVWIGLKYNHTQNSSISNYSIWANHYPSNKTDAICVQLSSKNGYKFINTDCNTNCRFLCNSCNGKINKYIGINRNEEWSTSDGICKNKYNTNLASLHSDNDLQNALIIIHAMSIVFGWGIAHIGLNDIHKEGTFIWSDGTSFDFANNISGGIYPWITIAGFPGEPNNGEHFIGSKDDDCTVISWNNLGGTGLQDIVCSTLFYPFICNMPSELCYFDSLWTVFMNINTNIKMNGCELVVNSTEYMFEAVLYDKQWMNDDLLVIEYMFAIYGVSDDKWMTGVSLNDFEYKIGFKNNNTVFISHDDEILLEQLITVISIDFGVFYLLHIEVVSGKQFNVQINNKLVLSMSNDKHKMVQHLSGYIGIFNSNTSIIAKSLYVSGNVIYEQTLSPTIDPTINVIELIGSTEMNAFATSDILLENDSNDKESKSIQWIIVCIAGGSIIFILSVLVMLMMYMKQKKNDIDPEVIEIEMAKQQMEDGRRSISISSDKRPINRRQSTSTVDSDTNTATQTAKIGDKTSLL